MSSCAIDKRKYDLTFRKDGKRGKSKKVPLKSTVGLTAGNETGTWGIWVSVKVESVSPKAICRQDYQRSEAVRFRVLHILQVKQ